MERKVIFSLFILLAIIQLTVPAVMIAKRELTLEYGNKFKFVTAPVDPYDFFRGRYIRLNFTEARVSLTKSLDLEDGQWVYAKLKKKENGFAKIEEITLVPPQGNDYLKVQVSYVNKRRGVVNLDLPFDPYYLGEEVAKMAENYYQELVVKKEVSSYVVIRVEEGFGVLEDFYLEGEPILEYIKSRVKN
mgnify:CR=1 FL=1